MHKTDETRAIARTNQSSGSELLSEELIGWLKVPLADILNWLDELNRIGAALSSEQNIDRLLETILNAAMNIVNADGGTIYRMVEGPALKFEVMRTDSLGIKRGGTSGVDIPFPPIALYDAAGNPNQSMVVAYSVLNQRSVNIRDAYAEQGFDFSGTREFDRKNGYRSTSILTVLMKNHEQDIIGVLQLINARDRQSGEIVHFSDADQRFAESLGSQAAIALTNRQLISQMELLFESFVKVINTAIDDKSPHTGKHCNRVPALTMMLADAVAQTKDGPFADFSMSDKDRFELKIAGLLHDCGKITTPMHVIEKASKLEAIFDRIELIDTRFEVLLREAEIEYLRACRLDPAASDALEAIWRGKVAAIESDREFLRHANIGTEVMSDDAIDRVRHIAGRYPWRDRAGNPAPFLSDNELENLTVRRGTLTESERRVIHRHIDLTIAMLESLPWPKHLKNVPEYAGGHHERMDGKGYPRGLTRSQMSVQARIMGIADIFEALSAKDRPYKKANTLSESLTILGKFCLDHHIDPDLFDIFIRQGVYLKYAREFLDPEQIDEVDFARIPGYRP